MRNKYLNYLIILLSVVALGFRPVHQEKNESADKAFASFEDRFLDAYWKQHPSAAIFVGYGRYYDELVIPDNASVAKDIAFATSWLDSLNNINISQLSDNNKISLNIIKNQLES